MLNRVGGGGHGHGMIFLKGSADDVKKISRLAIFVIFLLKK